MLQIVGASDCVTIMQIMTKNEERWIGVDGRIGSRKYCNKDAGKLAKQIFTCVEGLRIKTFNTCENKFSHVLNVFIRKTTLLHVHFNSLTNKKSTLRGKVASGKSSGVLRNARLVLYLLLRKYKWWNQTKLCEFNVKLWLHLKVLITLYCLICCYT